MTLKFSNILRKLPRIASKSNLNHQHAAIVIKNGAPIVNGFNHIKGNKTYHAEHAALVNYLSLYGFKEPQYCKQRVLWEREE